jgi:hypothetical protein
MEKARNDHIGRQLEDLVDFAAVGAMLKKDQLRRMNQGCFVFV